MTLNYGSIRINLYFYPTMKGQEYISFTLSVPTPISPFSPRRRP